MSEVKKRKSQYILAVAIVFIASLVSGIIFSLVYRADVNEENLAIDLLMKFGVGLSAFLFTLMLGFIITGILFKNKFLYIVAMVAGYLGIIFVLMLCLVAWWVTLIIAIGLALVVLFASIMVYRNTLSLVYSDEEPNHQTYEDYQRERAIKKQERAEENPEIKSFKDEK